MVDGALMMIVGQVKAKVISKSIFFKLKRDECDLQLVNYKYYQIVRKLSKMYRLLGYNTCIYIVIK